MKQSINSHGFHWEKGRDWQRIKTVRQNGNLNTSTYNGFDSETDR